MPKKRKHRRRLLAMLGALTFSWVCIGGEGASEAPAVQKKPNVVLITADDLGMQLSCYGDKIIKTPNMDKLYNEGVRFTNAFCVTTTCSPSRSSILTGLYPHQNGQIGLSHFGYSMHKAYPSIPNELKKAGYYTGVIGKIHVNPENGFKFDYHSNYTK